ncbi:T-cell differentiation antigen CD6-like isoform X2 [Electrophorus electricus]|uniref:T-cell differentiation antigen CD6-like isoform X2 n=1 Tax=Electrophorus electricus TaxID=8005 RepID=UPI0015D049A4|nr:T-cell differentiation antigen CD6-like isoform X2 [Electrophorus electricus]
MEAFTIMVVLHVIVSCQAKLYINQLSRPCSWNVTSPGQNQSVAIFRKAALHTLASGVCKALGCGEVYMLNDSAAQHNTNCLAGCTYHNHELINCTRTAEGDCRIVSRVLCAVPSIIPTSDPCVWNLSSPKLAIALTEEYKRRLSSEICRSTHCGEVFWQDDLTRVLNNSVCLTDCVYHNFHLWNCSTVSRSDCSLLSKIICGNHKVRLAGGSHPCAGRVELWRGEQWGTVCDDGWDVRDADVVCAQLGCGYALSVTGQGGQYSLGMGPVHLDELNCTGKERNLWECPAILDNHDCGHKEDAGVVCSEYKALRLTGGLDHCSGRVEVHRNGSWGTVCDPCWEIEEASMACTMLGCGSVKEFKTFDKPFTHKNGSLWYYMCQLKHTNLWQCKELVNNPHVCKDTNAAGVICEKSLGLSGPTTSNPSTLIITAGQMTTAGLKWKWSLELLICIGLSSVLLIAFTINVILCCLIRKGRRKGHIVQQQHNSLQPTIKTTENQYEDSIHLVKVISSNGEPSAQTVPPPMWTQSSIESGSYDTDYEPSESVPDATFPLSTFRNSMRYSADGCAPAVKGTHLLSVNEEDSGVPGHPTVLEYPVQNLSTTHTPTGEFQGLTAASSDSFDSSSTSSGEWYENTGHNAADLNTEIYENTEENRTDQQTGTLYCPVPTTHDTENTLDQTIDTCQDSVLSIHNQETSPCSGHDSPIYSSVTRDSQLYSSDCDYDDIGNY